MRIRAHAIMAAGGTAEPFEYDAELGPHDVLVRITHRTIARGDVQAIDNDWGDTRYPLVPRRSTFNARQCKSHRCPAPTSARCSSG